MIIDSTTLVSRYEPGASGVSRSWRFQPMPRSSAIVPPEPIAADIEPNRPMLTMMYAATLAPARVSFLYSPPITPSRIAGIRMLKMSTRRLRSSRMISMRR